ncbi:LuxR family transcriptional regulator [Paractinoplanes atraurantiacus]|uniref:LuxR family transcriptional regulator n=1 Tax=Paractinoplanes atraurantiacus TaxID=1036182 RepID=UPI0015CEFC3E|nr:LuxR family transcriptional regulator [Actinoplanes atraurantiacus]
MSDLIGRDGELQQLTALTGQALVLTGPPGIGKSALLAQAARTKGRRVLTVTGVPAESQISFAGLERMLRTAMPIGEVLADRDAYRVALALLDRLEPGTLLVADDAQWLDEQSWQALAYVGRRLAGQDLTLLMGMRDGAETARRLRGSGLRELPIGPVSPEAAAHIAGPGRTEAERARIVAEAAGNPLGLRDPARLAETYRAILSDLPPEARRLLEVAAVDDRNDVDEILRATGLTMPDLQPALDARLASLDGHTLRLTRPLEVADRRSAHAALAAVVDDPERRTWHLAFAATGPDDELATAMQHVARVRGTAVAWERAAELTTDPGRRAYRYLRAVNTAFDAGETATVRRISPLIDDRVLSRPERLWLNWANAGVGGDIEVTNTRLLTHFEAAERSLADGDLDDAFEVLHGVVLQLYFTPLSAQVRAAVVEFVQRTGLGADHPRIATLLALAVPLEYGKEVVAALPEFVAAPRPDHQLAWAALAVGALGPAKTLAADAVTASRSQRRIGLLTQALVTEAWVGVFAKDAHLIEGAAAEALRLAAETGQPRWAIVARLAQGMTAALRGEQAVAEQIADGAVRALLPSGAHGMICLCQFVRGHAALATGNGAAAFDHLLRLFDTGDIAFHPTVRFWAVGSLAEAAVMGGRTARFESLLPGLEDEEAATGSPALTRGLIYAKALLRLQRSTDDYKPGDIAAVLPAHPFDKARADHAYGAALRRERQYVRARPYLRAAASLFEALGTTAWADRSRQELRATGETVRRTDDRLTAQEAQIAALAAQGLTNKEIGGRLFLSPRTISTHLYRIFPKLGITSRSELGTALDTDDQGV